MEIKIIKYAKLPIELYQILKVEGLVNSGGEAKQAISEGTVRLNDSIETRKSKKVFAGDKIIFKEHNYLVEASEDE